jgi:hypothetical protein
MTKKLLFLFCTLFFSVCLLAQDSRPVPMADGLRSEGKIYVVVAVILTIFAGIIFYLVRLDRKISRLEKAAWMDQELNLKNNK